MGSAGLFHSLRVSYTKVYATLARKYPSKLVYFTRCGYHIMVIISVFQTEYAGSIPATRSNSFLPPRGGIPLWRDKLNTRVRFPLPAQR